MSYPPPPGQDPNNPYAQQPQQPQQPPQQAYGYPQQAPGGVPPQPGYGYPQQPQGGYPGQPAYGYPQQQPPGTVQANNGYVNINYLGTVRLATMGQRFLARLIDGAILGTVYGILMVAGVGGAVGLTQSSVEDCGDYTTPGYSECIQDAQDASLGMVGALLTMFLIIALMMALYEWLMIAFRGATFGKMAMGLRVVREADGQLPGAGSGFIRYIIPVVGAVLCYIGALLVVLSPFFDSSGKVQGWHDKAAGTLVIKK